MDEPAGQIEDAVAAAGSAGHAGQERFEFAPPQDISPGRGCAAVVFGLIVAGGVAVIAYELWRDVGWWAGAAVIAPGVVFVWALVVALATPAKAWAVEIDHDRRVLVFERCVPLRRLPVFGLHDRVEVAFAEVRWIETRTFQVFMSAFSIATARGTVVFLPHTFVLERHWRKALSQDTPGHRMMDAVLGLARREGWAVRTPASHGLFAGRLGVVIAPLLLFGVFTWQMTSTGTPLRTAVIRAGVLAAVLGIGGPLVIRWFAARGRQQAVDRTPLD